MFTGPFELSELGESQSRKADAAITRLKAHGYWSDRCEQVGIPALFHECPQLVNQLSRLVKVMMDAGDPTSRILSERAEYWAKTHGVSFSEGLSQVTMAPSQWLSGRSFAETPQDFELKRQADLESSKRALAGGLITQQMFDLAWQYANADRTSFKMGLVRVTAEHPEWFSALAKAQVERGDGMWDNLIR